jgi:hypothetical protein
MNLRGKPLLEQEKSIRAAVAQGGIFDFQRSHGKFVAGYTDAANYGVGVLMYGAGYSWASTLVIGNGYAILNSSPRFSMRRVLWWARGYNDAESGRLASRK